MNRHHMVRRGFTLIEVLVVTAIIGLLVAILTPSLRTARECTRQIVCRNNLRSIWTGIVMYTQGHKDRVPFMYDINDTDPDADPFDPVHQGSVCVLLDRYVARESWACPSPVRGYPLRAGPAGWRLTYEFQCMPKDGGGGVFDNAAYFQLGYDAHRSAYTRSQEDPAVRNYVIFDGRPYRLLDGRRYLGHPYGTNRNRKGSWNVRFPLIHESFVPDLDVPDLRLQDNPTSLRPLYPHRGLLQARTDLERARPNWERLTGAKAGPATGYHELHVDGRPERQDIYFTRYWLQHR